MWKCYLPLPYFPSVFVCVPMVLFTTQEKSCLNVNSLNLSKLLETFQRTSKPLLLLNLHHTQIGFVILYYIHWHGYFFCSVLFLGSCFFFFTNPRTLVKRMPFALHSFHKTSPLGLPVFCFALTWFEQRCQPSITWPPIPLPRHALTYGATNPCQSTIILLSFSLFYKADSIPCHLIIINTRWDVTPVGCHAWLLLHIHDGWVVLKSYLILKLALANIVTWNTTPFWFGAFG